uniref:Protoporphyrinogen oxidase n=1 Tax=Lepisosteus oculatus TaxID=7918 RepID=W5MBE3_LEPOC
MQRAVAVIGGGMSGLSACYHLTRSPRISQVALLEASGRLGGWLRSTRREDGAIFEHGPRGVRPAGAVGRSTLDMVSELGLEGEVLPVLASHEASKNRFLYVGGQLHRMPSGVGGLVRTVPPFSRPLAVSVLKELLTRRGDQEDESIHGFVERRLGKELADIVMDCLCRGVFAGDCRELSLRSCFPPLFRAERDWGSVVLGLIRGGGDARLPVRRRLARGSRRRRGSHVGMILPPNDLNCHMGPRPHLCHGVPNNLAQYHVGPLSDARVVLSARHAFPVSLWLQFCSLAHRPARILPCIQSVTVAVVNLEYEGSVLPFTGFGHLVPSFENGALLGIVYDSVAFPQHNRRGDPSTRLTVRPNGLISQIYTGSILSRTHNDLVQRVSCSTMVDRQAATAAPIFQVYQTISHLVPLLLTEKIRHYISHHSLPLSLVGASFEGVSVNDVIRSGQMAAERIVG